MSLGKLYTQQEKIEPLKTKLVASKPEHLSQKIIIVPTDPDLEHEHKSQSPTVLKIQQKHQPPPQTTQLVIKRHLLRLIRSS